MSPSHQGTSQLSAILHVGLHQSQSQSQSQYQYRSTSPASDVVRPAKHWTRRHSRVAASLESRYHVTVTSRHVVRNDVCVVVRSLATWPGECECECECEQRDADRVDGDGQVLSASGRQNERRLAVSARDDDWRVRVTCVVRLLLRQLAVQPLLVSSECRRWRSARSPARTSRPRWHTGQYVQLHAACWLIVPPPPTYLYIRLRTFFLTSWPIFTARCYA